MTKKVYKSAMGKTLDLGALILRNENVKAVGNMGVNARGDRVDGTNKIIDERNRQAQRRYQQQASSVNESAQKATSLAAIKRMKAAAAAQESPAEPTLNLDSPQPLETVNQPNDISTADTNSVADTTIPRGGLAAAIARSREIRQELDKTPRQLKKEQGPRKI